MNDPHVRPQAADPVQAANAEVQRALAALDTTTDYVPDDLSTIGSALPVSGPAEQPDESRRRYSRVRLHARGGMGQVWLASDHELGREVALKELRPELEDNESIRRRFFHEASITGRLEHPGIVPIYEMEQRPDEGSPFYTMRFIRGRTLSEAVQDYHRRRAAGEARLLELRQLVGAFASVCQTLAYAHAHGVLHRDLKGQNVVLGDYGEVVVLDWGLARQTKESPDREEAQPTIVATDMGGETCPGSVLGTPAYMSPEQAAGLSDQIDCRSDVYGLGAVLYEVLTGQPPFRGESTADVLERVRTAAPAAPREHVPDVPKALEAVCLRALSKRPEDRYASAQDLAQEVQRWLADEPVAAYREPALSRLARWGRRHRSLVSATGALLATLVVALSVGLAALNREQGRTREQRDRATEQARVAREQNRLALDMVTDVIFRVQNSLWEQPGLEDVRRELLTRAQDQLQKIAVVADAGGLEQAEFNHAWIHLQLGEIARFLGDGDSALKHYERSEQIGSELLKREVDVPRTRRTLATAFVGLGDVRTSRGDAAAAQTAYQRARDMWTDLAAGRPPEGQLLWDLAVADQRLGDAATALNDPAGAAEAYRRAFAEAEESVRLRPDNVESLGCLALSCEKLGDLHLVKRELTEAERLFHRSRELSQKVVAALPANAHARSDLARSAMNLGRVVGVRGDFPAARELFREALRIYQGLSDGDPQNALRLRDLAFAHQRVAEQDMVIGDFDAARDHSRHSLELREKIAGLDPQNAEAQLGLFLACHRLGQIEQHTHHYDDAVPWLKRAQEVLDRLDAGGKLETQPKYREWRQLVARDLVTCQMAERAVADLEFALAQPRLVSAQLLLARSFVLSRRGEHGAAAAAAEKVYELAGAESDLGYLYNIACCYALCAEAAMKSNSPDGEAAATEAERYALRAIELLREAKSRGFRNREALEKDADLRFLRSRKDFQQLVDES